MDFVHAHAEAITGGLVIVFNAVLTRCPKILENDIFQIIGTVFVKVFTAVKNTTTTPAA